MGIPVWSVCQSPGLVRCQPRTICQARSWESTNSSGFRAKPMKCAGDAGSAEQLRRDLPGFCAITYCRILDSPESESARVQYCEPDPFIGKEKNSRSFDDGATPGCRHNREFLIYPIRTVAAVIVNWQRAVFTVMVRRVMLVGP